MSSTNKTPNYQLNQFIDTDKPSWLGDYNGDNLKIDTAIKTVDVKSDSAVSTSNNASEVANTALETATSSGTKANEALTSANEAKTIANNAQTDASTAISSASQASTKADSALSTANSASSKSDTAVSNSETAINTANSALAKTNVVYDNTLTADTNTITITGLDMLSVSGYRLYVNGTTSDGTSEANLINLNLTPSGFTSTINRIMGFQVTPASTTVDKIANDTYTGGLILNRFTNGLGGSSESLLQFRPNSGTDSDNLLHCISTWGVANNVSGSTGTITSSFRGNNMTNVTSFTITAGTGSLMKAGLRIVVEAIR